MRCLLRLLVCVALLSGCSADRPPPSPSWFDGLPVAGSRDTATRGGFTRCVNSTTDMRCRHPGVMFLGFGPFNAAVDLPGYKGDGGFDQLTLWDNRNQNVFIAVTSHLEREGWESCYTGEGMRGDQAIYMKPGSPVWISMDLSYWGKRRLRVLPEWNSAQRGCQP